MTRKTLNRTSCATMLLLASLGIAAATEIRVSMTDAVKNATSKPQPEYTPIARQMKVAGKVEVEAVIGTDGSVESVKPVTGNPMLTNSAVTAVKRWKFTPFTSNGQPARAITTLSFDFRP